MEPFRVVFVNHTPRVSGAEHSLLRLISGLSAGVSPLVACPPGELADRASAVGVRWTPIPGTEGSLRLHPAHTTRAVGEFMHGAIAIRRVARDFQAQVVHANSTRAGISASLGRVGGAPAVVVHVQDCLPSSPVARIVRRVITAGSEMIIANSQYTARNFGSDPRRTRVVHGSVDLRRFAEIDSLTPQEARARLGLPGEEPVLGMVAQITPWKGQDVAVRALSLLRTVPRPRLLLVGGVRFDAAGTRHDNHGYLTMLRSLVTSLGLEAHVTFLGDREDIPAVLRALDLLLVPSWEEPFGLSVIEAMAAGVPVVATSCGGPAEIIDDGVDGTLVVPRQPARWASTIDLLLADPERRARHAQRARAKVEAEFSHIRHAASIERIYHEVMARRQSLRE